MDWSQLGGQGLPASLLQQLQQQQQLLQQQQQQQQQQAAYNQAATARAAAAGGGIPGVAGAMPGAPATAAQLQQLLASVQAKAPAAAYPVAAPAAPAGVDAGAAAHLLQQIQLMQQLQADPRSAEAFRSFMNPQVAGAAAAGANPAFAAALQQQQQQQYREQQMREQQMREQQLREQQHKEAQLRQQREQQEKALQQQQMLRQQEIQRQQFLAKQNEARVQREREDREREDREREMREREMRERDRQIQMGLAMQRGAGGGFLPYGAPPDFERDHRNPPPGQGFAPRTGGGPVALRGAPPEPPRAFKQGRNAPDSPPRVSAPPRGAGRGGRDAPPRRDSPPRRRSPPARKGAGPAKAEPSRVNDKDKEREREHEKERERARAAEKSDRERREADEKAKREAERRYEVVLPRFSFTPHQLTCMELRVRCPKLVVSPDFRHAVTLWDRHAAAPQLQLHHTFTFDVNIPDAEHERPKPQPVSTSSEAVRYFVKVLPFAGYRFSDNDGSVPVNTRIKCIVGKKTSGLICIGGAWQPSLDGQDVGNMQTLVNTAVRTFKEFTTIDLSACQDWIRLIDIHYARESHEEVTVILVPDIWRALPPIDVLVENWRQRQISDIIAQRLLRFNMTQKADTAAGDAQEAAAQFLRDMPTPDVDMSKAPSDNVLELAAISDRLKPKVLSLAGLLEYNDEDKDEGTFEVSLAAEAFHDVLMRQHGLAIIDALRRAPEPTAEAATGKLEQEARGKKRPAEDAPAAPESKRARLDPAAATTTDGGESQMTDAATTSVATAASQDVTASQVTGASQEAPEAQRMVVDDEPNTPEHPPLQIDDSDANDHESADAAGDGARAEEAQTDRPEHDDQIVTAGRDVEMVDATTVDTPGGVNEMEVGEVAMAVEKKTTRVIDEAMLEAFRYFDKHHAGYIKPEDLERILHAVNVPLSMREVRQLIARGGEGKINYLRLCQHEVEEL